MTIGGHPARIQKGRDTIENVRKHAQQNTHRKFEKLDQYLEQHLGGFCNRGSRKRDRGPSKTSPQRASPR